MLESPGNDEAKTIDEYLEELEAKEREMKCEMISCGIILIHGGRCLWITNILLVHGNPISWVASLSSLHI